MKIFLAIVLLGFLALAIESRNLKHDGEWVQLTGTVSEEERAKLLEKYPLPSVESRIMYGQYAAPGQFPWQVWLHLFGSNGGFVCGGTMVTGNHIITAAHCIPDNANAIDTHFDSVDRDHFPRVERAGSYMIHPAWEEPGSAFLEHDLTIVHIVNGVPFAWAALPNRGSNGNSYEGTRMIASGFGTTESGNLAQFLMFTYMTGHSPSVCNNYNMLCAAGSGNSMLGGGDSGGPLSIGNTLVGVISFTWGDVNGFTRVDRYLDWLGYHCGLPIWD